jgi:signal transduction histidine kinase
MLGRNGLVETVAGTWTLDDMSPLLDMLFSRSSVAVAVHDRSGCVVYLNRAMAALGPVPFAAYVGRPLANTAPGIGTPLLPFLRQVLETGTMVGDVALSNGGRHWASSCHPLHGHDGTVLGVCSMLHDDTERFEAERQLDYSEDDREAAERQLRTAERFAAIETLAAGIAHEVNNPLAAIVATAELARAMNADGGRRREVDAALARIVDEAHRGGTIVKSLLRFGRQDQGERWRIDVNGLVRGLAESPRVRSVLDTCRLRTRFARRSVSVVINPTDLEQVVLNLLQNAVQAGATEIAVRTAMREDCARIVVRDDGRGIDPQDIERIFDPFFTTRGQDGGTGLGLSIVHGIVSRYEGRIGVQSRIGRGTRFTVDLPSRTRRGHAA